MEDGSPSPPAAGAASEPAPKEECPICYDMRNDVQQLVHYGGESPSQSKKGLNVSSHRACGHCRQQLLEKNQSCPWCRERMEWQEVFGFLDGLKSAIGRASAPDELADLMSRWQEYEMTRSEADVRTFARDMIEDVALCAHLDHVLASKNVAFMRDSAGLWSRFHAMVVDGELEVHAPDAERLARLVESAMVAFEADGGGAPQHVGAMYTQLAVAVLCAQISCSSTATLVQLARRTGEACVRLHRERYRNVGGVRERLPEDYALAVSDLVWGGLEEDIIVREFFSPDSGANLPAGAPHGGFPHGGFPPGGFPPGGFPAGGFNIGNIDLSGLNLHGINIPAGIVPPGGLQEAIEAATRQAAEAAAPLPEGETAPQQAAEAAAPLPEGETAPQQAAEAAAPSPEGETAP